MKHFSTAVFWLLLSFVLPQVFTACSKSAEEEVPSDAPLIVFVTGDEEYRSEESMPMLARIVQRELGAKVKVCYSLDSAGIVAPNRTESISGLEALETADLMVLFIRFRNLPDSQRAFISDYAESGRPMVGFRTATHAFYYEDSTRQFWNDEWPTQVFGQQWITHHGHFEDGQAPLTQVSLLEGAEEHSILHGLEEFDAFSWLYHVDGGEWSLAGDSAPLLYGHAIRSNHEAAGRLEQFPLDQPVAWTKTYTGNSGQSARVFFTTLGHPYDFKLESMRRLALQGIYWALGQETAIPEDGLNVEVVGSYAPNNSGFGRIYKQGLRPVLFE
ncbi:MAG: ThuA domain-containing protein [Bacteroidota bacterium]